MASITSDKNDYRRILFAGADGTRKSIHIGKVSMRQAERIREKIESIVRSRGASPDSETHRWLEAQSDAFFRKLESVDLVKPRHGIRFGDWIDRYISDRTADIKPSTLSKLKRTKLFLLESFPASTDIRQIDPSSAAEWRALLLKKGLSEATIRMYIRHAKAIFSEAVKRELITRNPLGHLTSAAIASDNARYVTPEETAKLIDAAPDTQWKLLIGLARLAGLRIPSESHSLEWADVDFERSRMSVQSIKTERYAGHDRRTVPITPDLAKLLAAAFVEAEPGNSRVITISRHNLRRSVQAIARRAGIENWKDTFQTLRRSCEKQWAMLYPQFAVSKWMGHGIAVSGKHYVNSVPDELFAKAACEPTHIPTRNGAELIGIDRKGNLAETAESSKNPDITDVCRIIPLSTVGVEPTTLRLKVACSTN